MKLKYSLFATGIFMVFTMWVSAQTTFEKLSKKELQELLLLRTAAIDSLKTEIDLLKDQSKGNLAQLKSKTTQIDSLRQLNSDIGEKLKSTYDKLQLEVSNNKITKQQLSMLIDTVVFYRNNLSKCLNSIALNNIRNSFISKYFTKIGYSGNSTYYVYNGFASFNEAVSICKANNLTMLTINNKEENNYICQMISQLDNSYMYWLGLSDKDSEGTWKWVNGDPITYTNWERGQPDNYYAVEHFAHIRNNSCGWNDIPEDGYGKGKLIIELTE